MAKGACFVCFILLYGTVASAAESVRIELSPEQKICLEKMIYLNECGNKPEYLVHWRDDENFPSLGIGHFIWYSSDHDAPYQETFPALIQFLKEQGAVPPSWVEGTMPWRDREAFEKDFQSERVIELRNFLDNTRALQTEFIIKRMEQILPNMLEACRKEKRPMIEKKFYTVANAPGGMFAMIDYVNFKGEGILLSERLGGYGWGLLQVLDEMKMPDDQDKDVLGEFVAAAERTLQTRAENMPGLDHKSKVLAGWKNRVRGYLKIAC